MDVRKILLTLKMKAKAAYVQFQEPPCFSFCVLDWFSAS